MHGHQRKEWATPMARVKKSARKVVTASPADAAREILDRFPVSSIKLAERMGCTSQAIRKWRSIGIPLSLIHISEPTRRLRGSRMPSSA